MTDVADRLKGSTILNADEIRSKHRNEVKGPQGRIIAARDVQIGVGRYNDAHGIGHACIHIQDPVLTNGERWVYLISHEAAAEMIGGLQRVYKETSI